MLLQFNADNYKNFADGFEFSMKPNEDCKRLSWSIQQETAGGTTYDALSSGLIYGPNSAGKTNIISAMDTFKQIVLRGEVRTPLPEHSSNYAASHLELIPNRYLDEPKPVSFSIEFVDDGMHVKYAFSADMGGFMDASHSRQVLSEELRVNGKMIFVRDMSTAKFGDSLAETLDDPKCRHINDPETRQMMSDMIAPHELFLMNAFKIGMSRKTAERIRTWLDEKLIVLSSSQDLAVLPQLDAEMGPTWFHERHDLTQALEQIGADPQDKVGYVFDDDGKGHLFVSLRPSQAKKEGYLVPADRYESVGTVRLLRILPVFAQALAEGATLVMDEFDASLHTSIAQGIISSFHDDQINTNNAQLIVSSHNGSHLDANLYRKDEIHLVDVDKTEHTSEHYTLADFETYGESDEAPGWTLARNYRRGDYGALPLPQIEDMLGQVTQKSRERHRKTRTMAKSDNFAEEQSATR